MSKELELCLRYLEEVTKSGKVELLPASLAALFDVPLQVKTTVETPPYLEAFNSAAIALLKWADSIFIQRYVNGPDASTSERTGEDLLKLEKLTARLKAAFQDLLDVSKGEKPSARLSGDSAAACTTSVSSLDSQKSDVLNNNAGKPPPIPPRRTRREAPEEADSGIFDTPHSPDDGHQGIVQEPDSDDDGLAETDASQGATTGSLVILSSHPPRCSKEPEGIGEKVSGRLFSDGSMSELLSGLELSEKVGGGGENGAESGLIAVLGPDASNGSIDHSEETKEESSEHKTTTEEEEDDTGRKSSRKVTSSRQMFSTSSNSSSVMSSSSSGDKAGMDLLQKLLQEQKGKGKISEGEDGSLKVTETQQFRMGGRTNHRTLLETLDDGEWPPKGFGQFSSSAQSKMTGQGAIQSSTSEEETFTQPSPRPTDALVKRVDGDVQPASGNTTSKGARVRKTEEVRQEKAVQRSVNREARLNGELVGRETLDALDASRLDMAKAQTFDADGKLLNISGGGNVDEVNHRRHHVEDLRGRQDSSKSGDSEGSPPPLPPRHHHVDTYIGIFRPPDASMSVRSEDGSREAEFGTSALASYVVLRDQLTLHEEALRQKRTTFTFSNNDPTGMESSTTTSSGDQVSGEAGELIADFFEGGPGYLNLKNFWKQAQGMIQFPKKLAIAPVPKTSTSCPSPQRREEMPMAEVLGKPDASEYLLMRKSSVGTKQGDEVRGGTADALVVYATQPGKHILIYQEAFLITYRTFLSSLDLIRRLIWRYSKLGLEAEEDAAARKAARNTFCLLVRVVHDLGRPDITAELVEEVNEFVYRLVEENNVALARLLRANLIPRLAILNPSPPSPLPTSAKVEALSGFMEFRSGELAEQLTVLDSALFQKIHPGEMLSWAKEQSEARAPNLVAFTEHFNRISFWVRSVVIRQPGPRHRELSAGKFVKIMKHLRRLGNFNSYLAILSALDSGPLRRLDWSSGFTSALADHAVIMDSSSSFKNYRTALAASKPPCLPYIGLILQDLTFVHIGNPDRLSQEQTKGAEGILNFGKRWQQFTILDAVRRFKAWPYNLKRDERVLTAFCNFSDSLSEDAIWELSESIKPRGTGNK